MARAGAAIPAASNLGVRYGLLLKGADGEYAPARLDTEFHPGDSVRLRLEPNDGGYSTCSSAIQLTAGVSAPASGAEGRPSLLPAAVPTVRPTRPEGTSGGALAAGGTVVGGPRYCRTRCLGRQRQCRYPEGTVSSGEISYVVDTRLQAGHQKVAFKITLEFR